MVYPVIFGLQKHVAGNGFLAEVNLNCTAVLEYDAEDKEWWALGVQPGGFATSGASWNEAYLNLRQSMIKVLFDSAALTAGFDAFRADVEKLMNACHEEENKRWAVAREEIRAGKAVEESGLAELPRATKTITPGVVVRAVDTKQHTFVPSENLAQELASAA